MKKLYAPEPSSQNCRMRIPFRVGVSISGMGSDGKKIERTG